MHPQIEELIDLGRRYSLLHNDCIGNVYDEARAELALDALREQRLFDDSEFQRLIGYIESHASEATRLRGDMKAVAHEYHSKVIAYPRDMRLFMKEYRVEVVDARPAKDIDAPLIKCEFDEERGRGDYGLYTLLSQFFVIDRIIALVEAEKGVSQSDLFPGAKVIHRGRPVIIKPSETCIRFDDPDDLHDLHYRRPDTHSEPPPAP